MVKRRSPRRTRARGGGWTLGALALLGLAVAALRGGSCEPEDLISAIEAEVAAPATKRPAPRRTPTSATSEPSQDPGVHVELGAPVDRDASDDHLMLKPQYALSYHPGRNVANWVSWRIVAADYGPVPRHKGKFITDTTLPAGFYRVRHDDYVDSGYDRGHMTRSEERTRTVADNQATFLLTNILPQQHDLNAGPWGRLEDLCQKLVQAQGRALYVVAGGIFEGKPRTIGAGVAVPDAFFKVVVVLAPGQGAAAVDASTRVIAVIMPNRAGLLAEDWARYRTSVDEIERRTGYDLLPRLRPALQATLEARVDVGPVRVE